MVVAVFMMLFGVAIGGVAVVAAYARTQVLPPQTFADRVVTSLSDADVQAVVSGKLDAIVKERVGAAANTASVKAAVNRVIASPAIRQIAREQAQVAQQRVTEGTADDFTVDLAAALPLLVAQLQTVDPARAAALRTITGAIPVTWEPPAAAVTVRRTVDAIQFVGITAPVLAALLLFIAFVIAPKRQLLLALTGVLVAAVALTGLFAMARFRSAALDRVPDEQAAYGAIWDAFIEGLRSWWIVALGIGVVALVAGVVRPLRR
jgi:hypothetical protein